MLTRSAENGLRLYVMARRKVEDVIPHFIRNWRLPSFFFILPVDFVSK